MFTEQSCCFADGLSGYFLSVDGGGHGGVTNAVTSIAGDCCANG